MRNLQVKKKRNRREGANIAVTHHRMVLREIRFHVLTEADECALITHLVAVVGRAENGDTAAVVLHKVSLFLHLV